MHTYAKTHHGQDPICSSEAKHPNLRGTRVIDGSGRGTKDGPKKREEEAQSQDLISQAGSAAGA